MSRPPAARCTLGGDAPRRIAGGNGVATFSDRIGMQKKLKVFAGVTIGVAALGGAAAAGALPGQADNGLDRAEENVGIELPATRESHPTGTDHPTGAVTVEATEATAAEAAEFGRSVASDAQAGVPQEDGRAFGEQVSSTARETFQPEVPTAEDNPGTEHAEARADNAPDELPTAEDNPGAAHRP
jgi:hypothetical protein